MLAAIEWDAVTLAGAFALGAVVGSIATSRLTRALLTYLRAEGVEARRRPK